MSLYTFAYRAGPGYQWIYPSNRMHATAASVLHVEHNPLGIITHVRNHLARAGVPAEDIPMAVVTWEQYLLGVNVNHVIDLRHPATDALIGQYMVAEVEIPATGQRSDRQIAVNAPAKVPAVTS